jgi:hypothetical protein
MMTGLPFLEISLTVDNLDWIKLSSSRKILSLTK